MEGVSLFSLCSLSHELTHPLSLPPRFLPLPSPFLSPFPPSSFPLLSPLPSPSPPSSTPPPLLALSFSGLPSARKRFSRADGALPPLSPSRHARTHDGASPPPTLFLPFRCPTPPPHPFTTRTHDGALLPSSPYTYTHTHPFPTYAPTLARTRARARGANAHARTHAQDRGAEPITACVRACCRTGPAGGTDSDLTPASRGRGCTLRCK